jgi:hypothetical protein
MEENKYIFKECSLLPIMELETKQALEKVINTILKDKSLYDAYPRTYSRDGDKFTVMGLCDLACNHLFNDYPQLFGITKHQGHLIREYFHNRDSFINELYKEFPKAFEGESRIYAESETYGKSIDKNIPLF